MPSSLGTRAISSIVGIGCLLTIALAPQAHAEPHEVLPSAPLVTPLLPETHGIARPTKARPKIRRAAVTKSTLYVSVIGRWQGAIDRCRGPVAYKSVYPGVPWILAEHVHCGGSWALSTRAGTSLRINNGALAGLWRANGRTKVIPRGSSTMVTRGLGALVAQTCIPGTRKMRLVGFDRA